MNIFFLIIINKCILVLKLANVFFFLLFTTLKLTRVLRLYTEPFSIAFRLVLVLCLANICANNSAIKLKRKNLHIFAISVIFKSFLTRTISLYKKACGYTILESIALRSLHIHSIHTYPEIGIPFAHKNYVIYCLLLMFSSTPDLMIK